jgi:hypothetical protein
MVQRRQLVQVPKAMSLRVLEVLVGQRHLVGPDPPREDASGPVVVGLEELAQLVGLVGRRHLGIVRVGQHVVAAVVAHAAVDAADQGAHHLAVQLLRQLLFHHFDLVGLGWFAHGLLLSANDGVAAPVAERTADPDPGEGVVEIVEIFENGT